MLIEQNIKFELRGPGPSSRTCTPVTGKFHKNKNLKGKSSSGLLFTVKILDEAMLLTSPYLCQVNHLQLKFNNKFAGLSTFFGLKLKINED